MTGEPLALAHREALAALLAARRDATDAPEQTLSDATFANLYLFRAAHDWRWIDGERPHIAGHTYDGTRVLLPLFDWAAETPQQVRTWMAGHDAIAPITAAQAARLDERQWSLTSSRDDADYVYPADAFRHYRGRLLQKKANLARQLQAAHAVEAVPYAPALAREAEAVLMGWMDDKGKQPGDTDDGPCREALALADVLGFDGTLFRVDGRPAGFLLAEPLAPGVMVMRFAKGLTAFKGLAQHMFQAFCLARPDLRWLNFEQDLGLPNFRRTKLSYQPALLLQKFRARPR